VSHELARRNEQLKKDFANETTKYRTLVLAFEDLFLEYKDLLDVHGLLPTLIFHIPLNRSLIGSSLANGLPATVCSIDFYISFVSIHFLLGKRKSSQVSHLS
jgi:hypothetical protein